MGGLKFVYALCGFGFRVESSGFRGEGGGFPVLGGS